MRNKLWCIYELSAGLGSSLANNPIYIIVFTAGTLSVCGAHMSHKGFKHRNTRQNTRQGATITMYGFNTDMQGKMNCSPRK